MLNTATADSRLGCETRAELVILKYIIDYITWETIVYTVPCIPRSLFYFVQEIEPKVRGGRKPEQKLTPN